jgi:cell division protein FtsB
LSSLYKEATAPPTGEYGGRQVDQAKRLKELEQENVKLKRLVANLSLDKLVSKDCA